MHIIINNSSMVPIYEQIIDRLSLRLSEESYSLTLYYLQYAVCQRN